MAKYQEAAKSQAIDPMGWALAPIAYSAGQALAQAVEGAKSTDQTVIASWLRSHTVQTIVGDVTFGKDGEWAKSRVFFAQFQHLVGNTLDNFRDTTHEVVIWPDQYKTGNFIYPYSEAKKP
jgi:branched-chain amino acid transport system substrate-binding protein